MTVKTRLEISIADYYYCEEEIYPLLAIQNGHSFV
jgi:hypothetical protein